MVAASSSSLSPFLDFFCDARGVPADVVGASCIPSNVFALTSKLSSQWLSVQASSYLLPPGAHVPALHKELALPGYGVNRVTT